MEIIAVLLGGAVGSLSRYGLSRLVQQTSGSIFPYGTLAVNLIGCFFIGFCFEIAERFSFAPSLRLLIFVGFFGGFTTFSSFGLETVKLLQDGEWKNAFGNVLISNIGGITLVFIGIIASRLLLKILKGGSL